MFQASHTNEWDRIRAAVRKRLRETGAAALIVGGALTAQPSASAATSQDAAAKPEVSIAERVKRVRESLGQPGGDGAQAPLTGIGDRWNDHWKDHWNNHWRNH